MSEQAAIYDIGGSFLTRGQLLKRDSVKRYGDPGYRKPSAQELESCIAIAGWTRNKAAEIVGVSSGTKGSNTVRRWLSPEDSTDHRDIPYSAWRLWLTEAGLV